MNCYPLKIITLAYLSLFYTAAVNATASLPPILDYYPNCSYKVIENFTAKIKTDQPLLEKTRLALLTKLRNKGKLVGADAVILINKKINTVKNPGMSSVKVKKYRVSYEAELIGLCQNNVVNNQKLTPYNHQGLKVQKTFTTNITIQTKVVLIPPKKAKLNHPIVTNKELSLVNGIYGINIGTKYQQVIDKLGDPSIVLSMFEDEIILGYGRKHWFHFQNSKLVKVQSNLSIVSPALLNMVPLRDFFDVTPWLVANKIARKSSLSEVRSVIAANLKLNNHKEVIIKGKQNSLILPFSYRKHTEGNDKNYVLEGFSLSSNSYSEPKLKNINREVAQFETLGLVMSDLSQGEKVELGSLSKRLGNPLGRITVSATSYIDIYNSNLLVEVNKSELVSIQLLEEFFSVNDGLAAITLPWSLGDFVQEKTRKELNKFFPEDTYELGNAVQIDSDEFEVTLFFDDDNSTLYQAKVTIY